VRGAAETEGEAARACLAAPCTALAARRRHRRRAAPRRTYNLACLMTGMTTDETYKSQGVRINSTKYTLLRDLGKQTFPVKVRRAAAAGEEDAARRGAARARAPPLARLCAARAARGREHAQRDD